MMCCSRLPAGPAALALCLVLAVSPALALTFGDVVVSESYGSGTDSALCIVDFGTKSYAFRYYFSGSKTGMDMVLDLDLPHTGLDVSYTDWGSWGIFVDDFAYMNTPKRLTTGVYPGWAYWTCSNGTDWTSSAVGAGQRILANGAWDAWTYTGFDPDTWLPCDPGPVTPVPEPSSLLSLCGLALCPMLRAAARRRR